MIIDAHCHLWQRWPYEAVPDADRGDATHLLAQLNEHEVDRALVVCAQIGGGDPATDNSANNDDVQATAATSRGRLIPALDLSSRWSQEYHRPGVAASMLAEAERTNARIVTHYVADSDDGWLTSADGGSFLRGLAERGILLSLHAGPAWYASLAQASNTGPIPRILLHHLGHARDDQDADALARLATVPEVHVKVSGFHYVRQPGEAAHRAFHARFFEVLRAFGPSRMTWGSDFPVSRWRYGSTYGEELAMTREILSGEGDAVTSEILGGTAARLLAEADA